VVEELGLLLFQAVFVLVLQEAVVGGDDAGADILLPLAHTYLTRFLVLTIGPNSGSRA
jgi:hypothetical protein